MPRGAEASGSRSKVKRAVSGHWSGRQRGGAFSAASEANPAATVTLDQEVAWKLFSKGLDRESARRSVRIEGDPRLGQPVLGTLAVMA